jgi:predicted GNAT superfamily acetyltransferase
MTAMVSDDISFRVLTSARDLADLPQLEQRVWGNAGDTVAVNMLVATISEGGVAIGAFAGDELVGMVYGFATREPHVLHSHYLAVDPAWRRHGVGYALKLQQRAWCLEHGITAMRWTYDPMQRANAHLNLNVLGGRGVAYHVNYYGAMGGINGDLDSDRLIVQWQLDAPPPAVAEQRVVEVPAIDPADIAAASTAATAARLEYRRVLQPLVAEGWHVIGVDRTLSTYTLGR